MIRRSTLVAFSIASLTLASTAYVQATAPAEPQTQAAQSKLPPPDPAVVEKGVKAYTAQKCALCHSIEGKGNPKGPLDGVGLKYTPEELHAWLVNPKEMTTKTKATRTPMMRAYANLPKEELDALVAYMRTLTTKK